MMDLIVVLVKFLLQRLQAYDMTPARVRCDGVFPAIKSFEIWALFANKSLRRLPLGWNHVRPQPARCYAPGFRRVAEPPWVRLASARRTSSRNFG